MRRKIAVIISIAAVLLFLALSILMPKKWTALEEENYRDRIMSADGNVYYSHFNDFNYDGIKAGRKIGTVRELYEGSRDNVFLIDGLDNTDYILVSGYSRPSLTEKYHPGASKGVAVLDGGSLYTLFILDGKEFYEIKDSNVDNVAFILSRDRDDIDYYDYITKNGVSGEEAQNILKRIYSEQAEAPLDYSPAGRLLYYPENVDWFCFSIDVVYQDDDFYLRVFEYMKDAEFYHIPKDICELLGIKKF